MVRSIETIRFVYLFINNTLCLFIYYTTIKVMVRSIETIRFVYLFIILQLSLLLNHIYTSNNMA